MKIIIYQESVVVINVCVYNNLVSQSPSLTERQKLWNSQSQREILGHIFQESAHKRHQREKNIKILNYYKLNHKYDKLLPKTEFIFASTTCTTY